MGTVTSVNQGVSLWLVEKKAIYDILSFSSLDHFHGFGTCVARWDQWTDICYHRNIQSNVPGRTMYPSNRSTIA